MPFLRRLPRTALSALRATTSVALAAFVAASVCSASATTASAVTGPIRQSAATAPGASSYGLMQELASDAVSQLRARDARARPTNNPNMSPETNAALARLSFFPSVNIVRVNAGIPLLQSIAAAKSAPTDVAASVQDLNTLVDDQKQANGALAKDSQSPDIDTMFLAAHLGMAVYCLGTALNPTTARAWTDDVAGAADFLIKNKNLSWYTNGNIVVGNALVMALAWKLTGRQDYRDRYDQALAFAVSPDQRRWPGYGFVETQSPTAANGSDGRGYLTEAGSKPGYDGDYTQLQAEQLSRLFLLTRDGRVLRLLNMVTNELLAHTNTSTWSLDSSNGTRHNYPSEPFDTSAVATLALQGAREDLLPLVDSLSRAISDEFETRVKSDRLSDRDYYALGMIPTSIMIAVSSVSAEAPPQSSGGASPTPAKPTSSRTPVSLPAQVRLVARKRPMTVRHLSWQSDSRFKSGGRLVSMRGRIANTSIPLLFQSARTGRVNYSLRVAPGRYVVQLGAVTRRSNARSQDQRLRVRLQGGATRSSLLRSSTKTARAKVITFTVTVKAGDALRISVSPSSGSIGVACLSARRVQ